ncbi:MAG TPA: hypothetical protein IGS40_19645 [Trichormus sp. M33_DOE_039]|nr:hypothetical protein [Trichormus sp. M33_DOE_039]
MRRTIQGTPEAASIISRVLRSGICRSRQVAVGCDWGDDCVTLGSYRILHMQLYRTH